MSGYAHQRQVAASLSGGFPIGGQIKAAGALVHRYQSL